jgi:hypothetical protein
MHLTIRAAMSLEPKIIDDQFWTDWLSDYVSQSIDRRESAANRLITAVSWFWTAYTVTALLGTSLASRHSLQGWEIVVILSPIATLSTCYLFALWSLNPIVGETRQTAKDAKALWQHVLDQKLRRLWVASSLLIVSSVLILMSGYLVATSHGLARS